MPAGLHEGSSLFFSFFCCPFKHLLLKLLRCCTDSQTQHSASPMPYMDFSSSRHITNAFPALPNSSVKVILNKSLSLSSSLSQRLLDRKIKRLPPPLIVIGSYSFGAFHAVFQGQRLPALIFFVATDI